jgi:hypothetical protein
VTSLVWSKDGKRLLLKGRDGGCVTCDVPAFMHMAGAAMPAGNNVSMSVPMSTAKTM